MPTPVPPLPAPPPLAARPPALAPRPAEAPVEAPATATAATTAAAPDVRACLNCGTRVDDAFCPHCGQEYEGAVVLSTRLTFHDLIDDAVQINRSFFRTLLHLVVKPGVLTADYLTGRRARHVSPSKLYLVVNFVFFLLVQWFDPITAEVAAEITGKETLVASAQEMRMSQTSFAAGVEERIATIFPTWLFVLVPLFALTLQLLYLRSKRSFAAHAVFAFHAVAVTLVACVPGVLAPADYADAAYNVVLLGALPLWMVVALRHVYAQGWLKTALKAVLAWVALVLLIALYYDVVIYLAVLPA